MRVEKVRRDTYLVQIPWKNFVVILVICRNWKCFHRFLHVQLSSSAKLLVHREMQYFSLNDDDGSLVWSSNMCKTRHRWQIINDVVLLTLWEDICKRGALTEQRCDGPNIYWCPIITKNQAFVSVTHSSKQSLSI